MENKLKTAFDAVGAEPELIRKTQERLRREYVRRRPSPLRRWAPALACLLVVVLALGGCGVYFTPAATVQIQINPAVELTVNRFDRVIGTTALNEDGQQLLDSLDLRFLNYLDAVGAVLGSDTVAALLAQDRPASIDVSSNDLQRQEAMLDQVTAQTSQYENVHCSGGHGFGAHHAHTTPTAPPADATGSQSSDPPPSSRGHHRYRGHHG